MWKDPVEVKIQRTGINLSSFHTKTSHNIQQASTLIENREMQMGVLWEITDEHCDVSELERILWNHECNDFV